MNLRPALPLFVLFLAACSSPQARSTNDPLQNPLVAKNHYDNLGQAMANILIGEGNDLAKVAKMKTYVEDVKDNATQQSKTVTARIVTGLIGPFVSARQNVTGTVLLLDNTVYLGPDFVTDPGPSLHVYATKTIDPRDGAFPDPTAVDLGLLRTEFGAQEYDISMEASFNTVVLYDTRLKRVYGFAQLGKQ